MNPPNLSESDMPHRKWVVVSGYETDPSGDIQAWEVTGFHKRYGRKATTVISNDRFGREVLASLNDPSSIVRIQ